MATKAKKSVPKKSATTKVTRIAATDTQKPATKKVVKKSTTKKIAPLPTDEPVRIHGFVGMLRAIGGYFRGAWYELKQVSWPSRKATWSLTAAMIGFTGFFVVVILLLDALFKYLFELMIK